MSAGDAAPTLQLVGGPTAVISYCGLRLITDPTFDPAGGEYPRPGTPVVLHKLSGPALSPEEVEPIDAALVSHDHHTDNLDPAGRAFLPRAGRVLTTDAGAGRLEVDATGMRPGDVVELEAPDRRSVEVTALPADHGPPEVAPKNGPVIGFLLRAEGLPTVYVSGDNAAVDVVREIVAEHGAPDVAVLFCGGAAVPVIWGEGVYLTLTPETALEAAHVLGKAPIVPIHQEAGPTSASARRTCAGPSPTPVSRIGCARSRPANASRSADQPALPYLARRAKMARACDQASGVVEVGCPSCASTRSGSVPAGVAARWSSPSSRSAARVSPSFTSAQADHAVGAVQTSPGVQASIGGMP